MLTTAGNIQESKRKQASAKSRIRHVIGGLGKAYNVVLLGTLGYALINQAYVTTQELYFNGQAHEQIELIKKEQKKLVAKGWGSERYVGAASDMGAGQTAIAHLRYSVLGFTAGEMAQKFMVFWSQHLPYSIEAFQPKTAIIIPNPDNKPISGGDGELSFTKQVEATYRHEEGHAQWREHPQPIHGASSWSPIIAEVIVKQFMNMKQQEEKRDVDAIMSRDWRDSWLSTIRGEAFADAFSVLTQALNGKTAFKQNALNFHLLRMVGDQEKYNDEEEITSLNVIGSDHAVDMAIFMAAQLPIENLTRLSKQELMELAGRIADESLAWAIARQAPMNGFFSEKGQVWWLKLAAQQGLSPMTAKKEWEQWKKEAESPHPDAVFKDKQWHVAGVQWRARALPVIPSSEGWRFDGHGGADGQFLMGERDLNSPMFKDWMRANELMETDPQNPEINSLMNHYNKQLVQRRQSAAKGPLWTQTVLAHYLNEDPLKEITRFHAARGEKIPESDINLSPKIIKEVEEEMKAKIKKSPPKLTFFEKKIASQTQLLALNLTSKECTKRLKV